MDSEKINLDTVDSMMGTREDLKLHQYSQEETEQCLEKMQEQIDNYIRAQGAYENLICSLYEKIDDVLKENSRLAKAIEKIGGSPTEKLNEDKRNEDFSQNKGGETVGIISSKLHFEFELYKRNLKGHYKEKIREKRRKWQEKFRRLDEYYQETLESVQIVHKQRLWAVTDSVKRMASKE